MAAVGDDCYYYYYSSCAKGSHCLYRHCEAARGSETTCAQWQAGTCYRPNCRFRHMEIQMDRSLIPCYWESQPVGCTKPHCVFKHFKPRPFSSAQPQTGTAGNRSPEAPGSPEEEGQQMTSSGHSSPIVQPVIIPMIDSDVESAGTASNAGTPIKSTHKPASKSPPRSKPSVSDKVAAKKLSSDIQARLQHASPSQKSSPSPRSEGSPRSGGSSPSNVRSSSPPPLSRRDSPTPRRRHASPHPSRMEGEARGSPVRAKSVRERLGNRSNAAAASSDVSGKRPSVVSLKSIKSDKPAVEVMSLEETLRQRALESMMRAREQAAAACPVPESPVEHEEPQVDCRRVVVDSEPEQEEPQPLVQPKKGARISVRDRLGARVSPKKALLKTKKKLPAPVTLHEEVSDDDEPHRSAPIRRRRQLLTASKESDDYSEEETVAAPVRKRKPAPAAELDDFSAERVTAPLILRKRKLTPVTSPEESLSEEETVTTPHKKEKSIPAAYLEDLSYEPVTAPHKKKKSIPAAYLEDLSDESAITPPRKSSPRKRRLAPIPNPDDSSDDQTVAVPVKKKKSAPVAAVDLEDFSDEDEPVRVPVKKRLNRVVPSKAVRKEAPVAAVDLEDFSDEDEPVRVPVKKRLNLVVPSKASRKEAPVAAVDFEDFSDEDEPVRVPVKKRLNLVVPSKAARKEAPVTVTFLREPERLKPVKVTIAQDKPLKKELADRLGNHAMEQKRLKKKLASDTSEGGLKPIRLKLLKSTEKDTESPKLKPLKTLKARTAPMKKITGGSMKESEQLKKLAEDVAAAEGKPLKKLVVLDALEERKRLKKLMADHMLSQPAVEKRRRKITVVADEEEKSDSTKIVIPKSPQVLSLEEIRRRKMLKKRAESSESSSDSEKEKRSAVPIVSLLETKQRKQQKEARTQPVYDISLFTDQGEAEKPRAAAEEPRMLSLVEIRRRKQQKRLQEQHEDTATKRVTPAPAKRSKAEMQIYVPPPRKNAGLSSVKAANVSPPRETLVVKKRLGEPLPLKADKQGEPAALKSRIQGKPTAVKAEAGENTEGGVVVVKTFSEIMAEKRKKRQLERQQQQRQRAASSQQENNGSGGDASKKAFRFQPVVFGDSQGDSLSSSPKRVGGFSRAAQNVSPVTVSQDCDQSKPAQSTFRFSFSDANLTDAKVSTDSNPAMARMTSSGRMAMGLHSSTSHSRLSELSESSRLVSEPSKMKATVVDPLHHSSSMPVIAPLTQSAVSFSSCTGPTIPSVSQSSALPTVPSVPQPPALTPKQMSMTAVFSSSPSSLPQPAHESPQPQPAHVSSQPQPAHESVTPIAPSSLVSPSSIHQQSVSSSGKAPATEYRKTSRHLSTSRLLSETQDDLLLTESDAVTLDDGDQLDDLLMDIDSLLE